MKVKRMGITEILIRILLFSANKLKSSESFSKQPTQIIIELKSSLRQIIDSHVTCNNVTCHMVASSSCRFFKMTRHHATPCSAPKPEAESGGEPGRRPCKETLRWGSLAFVAVVDQQSAVGSQLLAAPKASVVPWISDSSQCAIQSANENKSELACLLQGLAAAADRCCQPVSIKRVFFFVKTWCDFVQLLRDFLSFWFSFSTKTFKVT